jgi:hypothetical protein
LIWRLGVGGLVAEVELLQALDGGEAGLSQVQRQAVAGPALSFQFHQLFGQVQVG